MVEPSFDTPDERFVQQVMECQRELYAYVLTLVPHLAEADDVLQETNLVIWRKRREHRPETAVLPWAKKIAYYQALAYHKRTHKHKLKFDDQLIATLADEADASGELEAQRQALSRCVAKLSPADRELLTHRYSGELSAAQMSQLLGRTADAIYQALYRIRTALARCVEAAQAAEDR